MMIKPKFKACLNKLNHKLHSFNLKLTPRALLSFIFFQFKMTYYAYYQGHSLIYLIFLSLSSAAALYVWNA